MNFETLQLDSPEIPERCREKYRQLLGDWPAPGQMDDRAAAWAMAWLSKPDAQDEQDPDLVTLVGVRPDSSEQVIGQATMTPKMKARDLVREQFGYIDEENGNDAAMAFWACEQLIEWMEKTQPIIKMLPKEPRHG